MATAPLNLSPTGPTIHEAERAPGPSGAVEWREELTLQEAIERRRQGLDIVVRGSNQGQNRSKAREIEIGVGTPVTEDQPHAKAGPLALPHFHQVSRNPEGHTFYELGNRKAKRKR